jgi:7,8-dihydropterin-6-yl-methyl-4-(beta-D-ribofuranosyl)aminobenzene 5'-phosphate synthase
MEEPGILELEPVDEVRIYDLMGDYAGVQGSRIEDSEGNVILRSYGNYDLYGPEKSFLGAHAFANFIRVTRNGQSRYLLFDVGQNEIALERNMKVFGELDGDFDPQKVEMILLSHGHSDHFYNLNRALEIINPGAEREIPIYVSGESFFRPRAKVSREAFLESREYIVLAPERGEAEERGGKWVVSSKPSLLMEDTLLYLGGIRPEAKRLGMALDYEMEPRPWPKFFQCDEKGDVVDSGMEDDADEDTSIAFHVRDKGMVVVSGCSHGGVNTSLLYAKAVSGIERVYCYYGGFHPNADVEATGRDLISQDIRYIVPTHCTPWPLVDFLWRENRKAEKSFMLTKNHLAPVGNVYTFSSAYQD